MRTDLNHVRTQEQLEAFGQKVEKLRADGMSYADIARRLGISTTTMESRIAAYRKLRQARTT